MNPIFHLIIPVFILLLLGVNKKWVFLLSPIALLPDIDFFYLHRALCHNIFFGAIAIFAIYFVFNFIFKDKINQIIGKKPFFCISSFYFLSHILLDYSGVAFLWPLSQKFYVLDFLHFKFSFVSQIGVFVPSFAYWFWQTALILTVFALMFWSVWKERGTSIEKV